MDRGREHTNHPHPGIWCAYGGRKEQKTEDIEEALTNLLLEEESEEVDNEHEDYKDVELSDFQKGQRFFLYW